MRLDFVKYQATGNDFIVINNFATQQYTYDPLLTQQLCHRQFGIGADGIITIEKHKYYDFEMLHYNADGSKGGGLCGNGSRAAIHYAQQLGLIENKTQFWAMDGLHTGSINNQLIYFRLQDIMFIEQLHTGYFVDNGTRHYIEIVENVHNVDMEEVGFPRRNMEPFQNEGVNLNFMQLSGNSIHLRTCECGLETEPLSCGTGAAAGALVAHIYYGLHSPIEIITKGGKLWIKFVRLPNGHFTEIYLIGNVNQSFHGVVDLGNLPEIVS
ncbi:diaminopimelate epimerase [Cardinium endosymbiont of Culicoides punctatus]|uniref:diaminopimelate epimerase n=1 Tax=Cardinium endosymbiont of Culicoides punctatus TaxID=2304601 RepID=UPI0014045B55|nr:diaminopimelate epimerase [Cardinium endosymbiont of Culicoides punctatus]